MTHFYHENREHRPRSGRAQPKRPEEVRALCFAIADLHKEQLAGLIPELVAVAKERVTPPLDEAEVARFQAVRIPAGAQITVRGLRLKILKGKEHRDKVQFEVIAARAITIDGKTAEVWLGEDPTLPSSGTVERGDPAGPDHYFRKAEAPATIDEVKRVTVSMPYPPGS